MVLVCTWAQHASRVSKKIQRKQAKGSEREFVGIRPDYSGNGYQNDNRDGNPRPQPVVTRRFHDRFPSETAQTQDLGRVTGATGYPPDLFDEKAGTRCHQPHVRDHVARASLLREQLTAYTWLYGDYVR